MEAIDTLRSVAVERLALDHDLGGDDTTRLVVLRRCENDAQSREIRVHTDNSVGFEWLTGMLDRYRPQSGNCLG